MGDFSEELQALIGPDAKVLSPNVIVNLKSEFIAAKDPICTPALFDYSAFSSTQCTVSRKANKKSIVV